VNKMAASYLKTGLKITMVIVISMLLLSVSTSCIRFVGLSGSGNVISSQRDVSGFDSISISAGMNLFIEQTGTETLEIEAEDNIIPKISTEVENGKLIIKYKTWILGFGGIISNEPVNVYVTVKDLEEISISSGARLSCEELDSAKLKISMGSGSTGKISVNVSELKAGLSSGSGLEIHGSASNQEVNLSSGVNYDAENLISESAKINISSGAVAIINVSDSLDVNISSGGLVKYIGSPQVISNISSGGSLQSISKN